jgi:hypothetical protein
MHFKNYLLNLLEQIDLLFHDYILIYFGENISDIALITCLRLKTNLYLLNPDRELLKNAMLYYSVKFIYVDSGSTKKNEYININ